MKPVNIDTILKHGGMHNPAVNICSYLNDTRLSKVSKAFRRANLRAMVLMCERLNLSQPEKMQMRAKEAAVIAQDRPIDEFEEEMFQALSKGIDAFRVRLQGQSGTYSRAAKKLWDDLAHIRQQVFQEQNPQAKADRLNMLVSYLFPLKGQLEEIEKSALPSGANMYQTYERAALPAVLMLRTLRLQRGFAAATRGLGDFHLPENGVLCLSALCEDQKRRALTSPSGQDKFLVHARAFSFSFDFTRFFQAELLLINREIAELNPTPPAPRVPGVFQRAVVALRWGFARIAAVLS